MFHVKRLQLVQTEDEMLLFNLVLGCIIKVQEAIVISVRMGVGWRVKLARKQLLKLSPAD